MSIGKKLAKYSFDDLFNGGAEKIYMDARDATVHIVCEMGGETVGKPYKFYKGNVTPVILKKEKYLYLFFTIEMESNSLKHCK